MDNMMIFENPEFGTVRTIVKDGEPWFVGKDVAEILGYAEPRSAVSKKVDTDDRGVAKMATPSGLQEMTVINESGLYSLVLSSKLPCAKRFKRWVTSEVLPSIRKHGAYATDSVLEQLDSNPDLIPDYLHRLREENTRAKDLRQQLETVQGQLEIAQPKADYYNTYIDSKDGLCFRYVAKELGIPERRLIQYLLDRKLVYRDAHRHNHVFPCAGPWQHLFLVRDFYKPYGGRGQYTLLTPAGKEYLMKRKEKIIAHQPKKTPECIDEICPASLAGVDMMCAGSK